MVVILTEVNYDESFICNLIKEIDDKISLVSDRDYKNQVYDLGLSSNAYNYTNLLDIRTILDKMLKCDNCYEELCVEDVVGIAKNLLNRC